MTPRKVAATRKGKLLARAVFASFTTTVRVAALATLVVSSLLAGADTLGSGWRQQRHPTSPDRMTEVCLNCHDGSVSGQITNHPVGMPYRAYLVRFPNEFNSLKGRFTQVKLVDGKVSCISCHELKNSLTNVRQVAENYFDPPEFCRAGGRLNTTNGITGLCQSCHNK